MAARKKYYLGGVCLITDKHSSPLTCIEMTREALKSGIRWIQYRDKDKNRLGFYRTAVRLREITRDYGATFIVNDHVDIAAAVDADGVHLGQDDFPVREARRILGSEKIIGLSTHSMDEALSAETDGADYIGFGPVFKTGTKDAGRPRGVAMLGRVGSRVKLPVVAIGGIDAKSLPDVLSAGAGAVAVASGVLKGEIGKNVAQFFRCIRKSGRR